MSATTGARPLLKVAMKQDARNIGPWVFLISMLSATSIMAYRWIFSDLADRRSFSMALGANPALELVFGPARNLLTNDGFNAWRAGQLGAFFAGLMAILVVVRNSRADEDSGQAELIASGVITRQARLLVAVAMAAIAAVALGVVCFLLTWAFGGDPADTAMISATFTCSALMFAGVAAVAAQLGSDARTASSIAIAVLGVFYVARGYLDSSGAEEWTQWLTPFGWLEQTKPALDNNWWPLLPCIALFLVLVAVATVLQQHRDFGLGMVSPKPAAAEAPGFSIWGLALRLNRGGIITWFVAFAFLGLVFGNLATSIGDVIKDNPAMQAIIASGAASQDDLGFAFVATILQIVGIIAAVMGVQVVMRMYSEEVEYRAEPLLAGSLARPKYLLSNAVVALAGTALGMTIAGTVLGLVASTRGSMSFGDVLRQAVSTIPAVWVLVCLALALVANKPSKRFVGWLAIVATFALTLLGPSFKLPEYILGISPLHHVPNVASVAASWTGLWVVCGVAVLFFAAAMGGYRRRDVI